MLTAATYLAVAAASLYCGVVAAGTALVLSGLLVLS